MKKLTMKTRQKVRRGLILNSFFLFPALFYYLSPVLILQSTTKGIVNGSCIVFLLMFGSAFFLGRAYCGWICPGAGCQEALFAVREKRVTDGNFIKWIIWTLWIGAIVFLAVRRGGYVKIDFFYQTLHGLSVTDVQSLITYFCVLFILIVIPALLWGKRAFCHGLCWMAPFMILGHKIGNAVRSPALRISANSQLCIQCHSCTQGCPMSIPVELMVKEGSIEHAECILCGTCIDLCPASTLRFVFTRGRRRDH